jgi:hypothetical protein
MGGEGDERGIFDAEATVNTLCTNPPAQAWR